MSMKEEQERPKIPRELIERLTNMGMALGRGIEKGD